MSTEMNVGWSKKMGVLCLWIGLCLSSRLQAEDEDADEELMEEDTLVTAPSFEPTKSSDSPARPWVYRGPWGQTAYVLDRYEFDLGTYGDAETSNLDLGLLLLARYGWSDRITFGLGTTVSTTGFSGRPFLFEIKWNFLNRDLWSFSVALSGGGIPIARREHDLTMNQTVGSINLSASRVLSERSRLHLLLGGGASKIKRTYSWLPGAESISYYDENYVRLSTAFENQPSSHGYTLGVAIECKIDTVKFVGQNYDMSDDRIQIGLFPGVAYHFFGTSFSFTAGFELGPALRSHESEPYRTTLAGNAMLGLGYKF